MKGFSFQEEWHYPFWTINFFHFRDIYVFYYVKEESDDVIGGSTNTTNTVQNSVENISRNIKAVFFKLGTRPAHHKRNKMAAVVPLS